jgi:alginate O-acetyltransferase complex protein AlgI
MTFTSLTFLAFLGMFFPLYWLAYSKLRLQNLLVLGASYVFYGWWDWRFLGLIVTSSLVDFLCAQGMSRTDSPRARRAFLVASIVTNLGILGFFKYFNFFVDNAVLLIESLGIETSSRTLYIILPVGISFYTLQSMGYTIDVFRRRVKPCGDPIAFFAFVGFFPQLVAGPIERAESLLAQFLTRRRFDYHLAMDGLRQMGWGFFKKIFIADNLGIAIDGYFAAPQQFSSGELAVATVFFGFQIYCDFSGYSDIAIGTGKILGFRLRRNFRLPYFATSFRDFWSRWHMSLTSWFRDYLYLPLGGSRGSHARTAANIFTVFLVSGLWHGAQWTFVAWGAMHGFVVLVERVASKTLLGSAVRSASAEHPIVYAMLGWLITFVGVMLAWVFFRAVTIGDALFILERLLAFETLTALPQAIVASWRGAGAIALLFAAEWMQRDKEHPLQFDKVPITVQQLGFVAMVFFVVGYGAIDETPFIYFQF